MTTRSRQRLPYALASFATATGGIALHMVLTRTPPSEYWWAALVVPVAVPLAAVVTARTCAGRWVAWAGALCETPLVLLFFAWGGFVVFPSLVLLWLAALA